LTGRDVGVVLGGGGGGGGRGWGNVPARGKSTGGPDWHKARLGLVEDERLGDPKGCELGKESTLKYTTK